MIDLVTTPKAELHRHLEGSFRIATLHELAGRPGTLEDFRALLEIRSPVALSEALARFDRLREPVRGEAALARLTFEALQDAGSDGIDLLELRLSPWTLARSTGLRPDRLFAAVEAGLSRADQELPGLRVGLVVVISRGRGVEAAREVAADLARRQPPRLVGIDLASDELRHRTSAFAEVARRLHGELGLPLTVHTGEGVGPRHVAEALALPGVRRLGHALSLAEDPDLVAEARQRGLTVEVCPTSNLRTGLVARLADHPARVLLEADLSLAVCTDDPTLFDVTLSSELALLHRAFALDDVALAGLLDAARAATFLAG